MQQQESRARRRRTSVVGRYFGAAVAFLFAGSAGLAWIAPDLSQGLFLSPHVAGVTHAFTLGFLTLTIFGALGQLMPVALGARRYSMAVSGAALWLLVPGIALFAAGVASNDVRLFAPGVILLALGVLANIGNVSVALATAPQRGVTWYGVAGGIGFLGATLVFGMLLTHNLHTGFLAAARVRVLAAHVHLALVGWVLMVIVGVAHRILPMFLAAPDVPRRLSAPAMALLAAGAPLLAAGVLIGVPALAWTAAAALFGGVALFVAQGVRLFRGRAPRPLNVGMHFVRVGLAGMALAAATGPFVLAAGIARPRLAAAYAVAALLAGLVPFVVGIMYEIEPVVSWNARFAGRLNRGALPRVTDLYSRPAAWVQLTATAIGVALLLAGIAAASPGVARAGAATYGGAHAVFAYQVIRIRWGRPRRAALAEAAT
ncbi:MAG TPA: hypothetical protein VF737_14680 [Gemmatimonadaceae bacterium]